MKSTRRKAGRRTTRQRPSIDFRKSPDIPSLFDGQQQWRKAVESDLRGKLTPLTKSGQPLHGGEDILRGLFDSDAFWRVVECHARCDEQKRKDAYGPGYRLVSQFMPGFSPTLFARDLIWVGLYSAAQFHGDTAPLRQIVAWEKHRREPLERATYLLAEARTLVSSEASVLLQQAEILIDEDLSRVPFDPAQLGRRRGTTSAKDQARAYAIKALYNAVPANLANRYAVIGQFLHLFGIPFKRWTIRDTCRRLKKSKPSSRAQRGPKLT